MTPQATGRRTASHIHAAHLAKTTPDQWIPVRTYPAAYSAQGVARAVTNGTYPAYTPAGHYQARTQPDDNGTTVYIRYIGQDTQ